MTGLWWRQRRTDRAVYWFHGAVLAAIIAVFLLAFDAASDPRQMAALAAVIVSHSVLALAAWRGNQRARAADRQRLRRSQARHRRNGSAVDVLFVGELDDATLASIEARLDLESEFEIALDERQFFLQFQPLVDLDSGVFAGIEALVRWRHPERGVLPPAEFIPMAEETGLIVPLGEWIVDEALAQAAALERRLHRPLHVGINLSAPQLQSDLVSVLEQSLARHGLPADRVVLEITETCVMAQDRVVLERLRALRGMGVRIAIDDFGTGYSSLAYLKRLPIDILKIDRSFVHAIDQGPEASALAHAIIRLAELFGLRTVGEGIEQPREAETLRALGCHSGQGFHFGPPMAIEQVLDAVLSGRIPLDVPPPGGTVTRLSRTHLLSLGGGATG